MGFLCFLLVVIVCKLLRYLFRDTSRYMPRGHRVFNKLTPLWGCVTSEAVNRCCVIHFRYSLGEEVVFSSLPTLSLCVFLAVMWIVVYSWHIFWGPHLYWATRKLSVVNFILK